MSPAMMRSFLKLFSSDFEGSNAKTPTLITPQNLQQLSKTQVVSYLRDSQYDGIVNYTQTLVNTKFNDYLMWTVIIQAFFILLIVIFYIDVLFRLKTGKRGEVRYD